MVVIEVLGTQDSKNVKYSVAFLEIDIKEN
jgi:hypothetical protein